MSVVSLICTEVCTISLY